MNITRRQLRRIIKEEMLQGNDLEAFYALIYTAQYVTRYNGSLANGWRNYSMSGVDDSSPEYRQTLKGHGKLNNALEKLDTNLLGPIMDLDADFDAPPSERDSIEDEAYNGALIDFQEDVFKGIEEIEKMMNVQTPIGMSVISALNHFADSSQAYYYFRVGGNHLAGFAQDVINLMNDNEVLLFLDTVNEIN